MPEVYGPLQSCLSGLASALLTHREERANA